MDHYTIKPGPKLYVLTPRQQQILDFIRRYSAMEGRPPTMRCIASNFGITSPNGVLCHLKALQKKGFLANNSAGTAGSWMLTVEPGCCKACGQKLPEKEVGVG